ncbi:tetratricopeptide repeat protein [candidate division WOR-3 bacterium]|nr:tetratricopeptide repeat protein [candidate division WOR-3 bacterium]MCK4529191.1 tetratricopeptide repeat protein [candidate division WOR-3 bacterium]
MTYLLIFILTQITISDELKNTRKSYLIPLRLEPAFIDKGETYLNLSVIDIRLGNYETALTEAKLAAIYACKDESEFLQGIIYYYLNKREIACEHFKKVNRWQYPYFLQHIYEFSFIKDEEKLFPTRMISDSLRFYFIFYDKDTILIRKLIEDSTLPLWQTFLGQGYLAYKNSNYKEALSLFQESYEQNPTDYTGICIIATQFRLSMIDSLLFFQESNSIFSPLATYLKAEALYRKGSIRAATRLFLADTASPYKTHALFGAGWSTYRLEEYSASVDLFQKFLNIYKDGELREFALYRLARGLLKQGKVSSLNYFEQIVKEYPNSNLIDDTYLLLGKIHFLLGHLNKSLKWFQRLILEYPDSRWLPYAHSYLARIFTQKEDYEKTFYHYSKILEFEEVSEQLIDEAHYRKEEIKWKMGKYPTKLSMHKSFIDKYPNSPRTPSLLLKIGEYYTAAARPRKAISFFEKILNDFSDSEIFIKALFDLERVYLSMGKAGEAIELLEKQLPVRTEEREEIHRELGDIYYKIGNSDKAIQHYREIKSKGILPYALYRIGLIYFELGLFRESRIPFRRLINAFPNSQYLGSAYLLLARSYIGEGYIEDAINIVNQGYNKLTDKKRISLLLLKAEIYCQRHDKEALNIYKRCAEMMGEDVQGTIKVLNDALKCAERLHSIDEIEYFHKQIEVLQTYEQ